MIEDARLEALAKGLQHWRTVVKKHRGEPYPAEFLSKAIVLAKELGIGRVSVATGIPPQKLGAPKKETSRRGRKPKSNNYSKVPAQNPPERLVVELESGKRVSFHLSNTGRVLAEMLRHV